MTLTVLLLGLLSILSPFILVALVGLAIELYERRRKDAQLIDEIDRAGRDLKREHPVSREIAVRRGLQVYREQVHREGVPS